MAKIFPFKGIMYNKKVIDKMTKVMAPPYDVISPEDQEKFYSTHPYNVIRLILGKEFPGDNESNNKYVRSEKFFESWLKHGLLEEDVEPCLYVYEQIYKNEGKILKRLGFLSLLRLEDFDRGKVLPHEETFPKHKMDRLELKRICSANFDSIFAIFSDEKLYVEKILKKYSRRKPHISVKDGNQVTHNLWRIDHKGDIKRIIKFMSDRTVFIADGHHRYEASLKYRDEMKDKYQKFTGEELYNHVIMYLTHIEGKGLSVFPIHRVIRNIPDLDVAILEEAIKEYFEVEDITFTKRGEPAARKKLLKLMKKAKEEEHAIGMLLEGLNKYCLLKLKEEKIVDKFAKDDKPKEWRRLDVTVLHAIIISHILGIRDQSSTNGQILYIKDDESAAKKVLDGECQLAFFLNPTKVSQIIKIANEKEKMPQKSTYFYPKLLSGLLMNKIYLDEKAEEL